MKIISVNTEVTAKTFWNESGARVVFNLLASGADGRGDAIEVRPNSVATALYAAFATFAGFNDDARYALEIDGFDDDANVDESRVVDYDRARNALVASGRSTALTVFDATFAAL